MEILLKDVVEIQTVLSWKSTDSEPITFRMYRDMTFEIGAEGIAIGFLQSWASKGIHIDALCTFNPDISNEYGGFGGLFGLQLVYVATRITVVHEGVDIREILRQELWRDATAKGGTIGDSKRKSIVFRDPDYLIPGCMQDQGNEEFPYNDRFRDVLVDLTRSLGVSPFFGSASAEKDIVTYVYEASRNAFEHGRVGTTAVGIRGIIVQKVIFASEEEVRRRPCSMAELRDFYFQNWSDVSNPRKSFLATTICDLGPGIQSTLPAQPGSPSEGPWERLNRAIFTNASRKPGSDELARGRGLPSIVEASRRLKAFLLVCSGELIGFLDGSNYSKYPKGEKWLNKLGNTPNKTVGTSLTLVWPTGAAGEQLPLIEK